MYNIGFIYLSLPLDFYKCTCVPVYLRSLYCLSLYNVDSF